MPSGEHQQKYSKHMESLYFDPLCFLNFDLLHRLFTENGDVVVSKDFFMTFAKAFAYRVGSFGHVLGGHILHK